MTPRIGVIADNSLQGHLLSSVVKTQGYELVVNTDPDQLEGNWLTSENLELWVVDLTGGNHKENFLDQLLESPIPVLFCDGQAPSQNSEGYPRWERRLLTKILIYVPKPEFIPDRLDSITSKPTINIPIPTEFAQTSSNDVPERVCVLGASLGGPVAVKLFLDCLPANLPVAFLLAQHIDGGFLDTLAQVLCRDNDFECRIGFDGENLGYGKLLIAPIEYEITFAANGKIYSTGKEWQGPYAPSIDQVIENMTRCYESNASVILFSGMGNDGAIAAPRLAHAGGRVWLQSTESCIMPSQPDATRATGCASYSGTPEELALQLVESVRQDLQST